MDKIKIFFSKRRVSVILGVILIFIGAIVYAKNSASETMILFYGDTCPHCQIVETYIQENGIKNKIQFEEKEVFQNQANAALLQRKAKECHLDLTQGIGVPFFFDGQQCLMGDEPIINYFKALK